MKIGALRSPCRAVPPPFCRPNFLPVRATSERSRAARAVPRRFSSCQVTTRWRMSARGSTAKISSLSSMSPLLPASRVCTLTFILAFLALVSLGLRLVRLSLLNCFFGCLDLGFGLSRRASFLLGGDGGYLFVARQRRDLVDRGLVDQARLRHVNFFFLERLENSRRVRRGVRARKLDRIADGQPAALVTRNRALDEEQAADRI